MIPRLCLFMIDLRSYADNTFVIGDFISLKNVLEELDVLLFRFEHLQATDHEIIIIRFSYTAKLSGREH